MKRITLLLFLFVSSQTVFAQQWGLYTFYAPQNQSTAYLIDTNNTTYKSWSFSSSAKNAYSSYFTEDKIVVRTYKPSGAWGSGGCTGGVQKVNWSGTVIWDFQYFATNDYCLHHDICPLPNGNVLMICYDYKTATEAVQAGLSSSSVVWSERIIEVMPTGTNTGTIVWEWYLWDHLCQSYNSAKDNYVTNTADHPELMNINYAGAGSLPDRYHMNGIDYNAALDQIIVSMHYQNAVFVIDHSTTTAQAAGHTGGNSGKGGDFLYRWGNPTSYGASGSTMFDVIHDAHYISTNNPNYPGYMCGYNNEGGTSGNTAITIWNPPYNGYNYSMTTGVQTPSAYTYQFTTSFSASNMGNSQQLPNGNMLICNPNGAIYEINSSGTQLWTKTSASSVHAYRYDKCYVRGPVASVSTDTSICAGESINLNGVATSVTETSPTYTWSWASSPTGFSSTSQNNTVSPTTTTTYILTVTNTAISCWDTVSVKVNVYPAPAISASASSGTICNGQSATLTASGGSTYSWSTGGSGASINVSPTTTTTYTVTGANAGGCSNTAAVTVTVSAGPTILASANPGSICSGQSVSLSASGATTYSWSNGAGNGTPVSVSPTSTTTYTVTGTTGSCSNTATVTITVSSSAAVSVSANPASVCSGSSTTLTASGATTYVWSNSSTVSSISVAPTTNTTYSVTGTFGACTGSANITIVVNPLPSVSASGSPATVCAGQSATLTGSGALTYSWSHSAGSGGSVSVIPTATTTYSVTGTNNNGCTNTASVTVAVNPVPAPTAVLSASATSLCSGNSTTLTASGGSSYTWNQGLGNGTSYTVSPTAITTYIVTVSNGSGCDDTASVTITVNPLPTVTASASLTSICLGQSTVLSASGNAASYTWDNGLGSGTLFTVSPTSTTTYHVTAVSAGSCSATAYVTVTADTCSHPVASLTASDYNICAGQSIVFTDQSFGSNVDTWNWQFPGGSITSATTQGSHTITYSSSGTYSITLTIADDNGMDDTTITISVASLPNIGLSASPIYICEGKTCYLYASGGTTYTWNQGLPAGNTQVVTPTSTTEYQVTGTEIINGCQNSASVVVTVNPLPDIILVASDSEICQGESVNISVSGGSSYIWNQGLTGTSNSVTPVTTTTYQVTGTNTSNCSNTASVTVVMNPLPATPVITENAGILISSSALYYQWYIDGAPISGATSQNYTPVVSGNYTVLITDTNGCSTMSSVYSYELTSIEKFSDGIRITPNPTSGLLIIDGEQLKNRPFTVKVTSAIGKLMLKSGNDTILDLSSMSDGLYYVTISQPGKPDYIVKIVLSK